MDTIPNNEWFTESPSYLSIDRFLRYTPVINIFDLRICHCQIMWGTCNPKWQKQSNSWIFNKKPPIQTGVTWTNGYFINTNHI
jgi:hypothetical protein